MTKEQEHVERLEREHAQIEKFTKEVRRFSERGIWPDGAPNDEQRAHDDGFKSALAHVEGALSLILEGKPYTEYEP